LMAIAWLGAIPARAQSGCCSSHRGVCGCACCDGTPLSNVCHCEPTSGGSKPGVPGSLLASLLSPTECRLSWTDSSSNEDSFEIQWSAGGGGYSVAGTVPANTGTTTIRGLTPGASYDFRIRARSFFFGDSEFSTPVHVTPAGAGGGSCIASPTRLCLAGNRFQVEGTWQTATGGGAAQMIPLGTDSGFLWFYGPSNVEVVVKVLDACGVNQRFWVFAGGLTNVKTVLTITDTKTGQAKTYTGQQGVAFKAIQDTGAFATCP
jgi:hypothetical protein